MLEKRPTSIVIVRIALAILLGIHGYTRCATGGPPIFGEWLTSIGIPFGLAVAWGVTIFEMIGSLCLLSGFFVVPAALGHVAILLGGIVLVHAKDGWFVVGGGRNGVEYSVLLIAGLVAVIVAERERSVSSTPDARAAAR